MPSLCFFNHCVIILTFEITMNSAAVIGRQLRQQAVSGRSSGPMVQAPPVHGKHRPRTPSHVMLPLRPHSPAPPHSSLADYAPVFANRPGYASGDRMQVFCSAPYADFSTGNPLAVQRDQRELAAQLRKSEMARTQPKLHCTWHCFCVAFKALSGGIVLLVVGTVMSVIGFLAEANLQASNQQKAAAERAAEVAAVESGEPSPPTESPEELHAQIRNLTFAGPVIMGLGGIVIVAALVLTFEVRDTLGIKQPPPSEQERKQRSTSILSGSGVDGGKRKTSLYDLEANAGRSLASRQNSMGAGDLGDGKGDRSKGGSGTKLRKGSSRRSTLGRSKRRRKTAESEEAEVALIADHKLDEALDQNAIEMQEISSQTKVSRSNSRGGLTHRSHRSVRTKSNLDKHKIKVTPMQSLDVQKLCSLQDDTTTQRSKSEMNVIDVYGRWAEPSGSIEIVGRSLTSDSLTKRDLSLLLSPSKSKRIMTMKVAKNPIRTLSHTFSIASSDLVGSDRPSNISGPGSPPDTDLSDADGCSLPQSHAPWPPSKCSCSASPVRVGAVSATPYRKQERPLSLSGRESTLMAVESLSGDSQDLMSCIYPSTSGSLIGATNQAYTVTSPTTESSHDPAASISNQDNMTTGNLLAKPDALSPLEMKLNWNLRLVEQQRIQQQLILQQQLLLQQQQQQLNRLLQQQQMQQHESTGIAFGSSRAIDDFQSYSQQRHLQSDSYTSDSGHVMEGTESGGSLNVVGQRSRQNSLGGIVGRLEAGLFGFGKGRSKTIASIESDGLSSSCSSLTSTSSARRSRPATGSHNCQSRSQLIRSLLLGSSSASDCISGSTICASDSADPTRPLLFDDNNNRDQLRDSKCTSELAIELDDLSKPAQR